MTLRKSHRGKGKGVWTNEDLVDGFQRFYELHRRYPTATEVDAFDYLPSARSLQRSFGGLVATRKALGLQCDPDLRTGTHSSTRAHTINKRAQSVELSVYEYLTNRFGKPFVHREYLFTDDKKVRADFFVYDGQHGFCVDVFYPKDIHNMVGCVNSKQRLYQHELLRQYPVLFLCMNSDISSEQIAKYVTHKTKMLPQGVQLVTWEQFVSFCNMRTLYATKG